MDDVCCPEQEMHDTSAQGLHLCQGNQSASEVSFAQDALTQNLCANQNIAEDSQH